MLRRYAEVADRRGENRRYRSGYSQSGTTQLYLDARHPRTQTCDCHWDMPPAAHHTGAGVPTSDKWTCVIATLADGYYADVAFNEGFRALAVECGIALSHVLVLHSLPCTQPSIVLCGVLRPEAHENRTKKKKKKAGRFNKEMSEMSAGVSADPSDKSSDIYISLSGNHFHGSQQFLCRGKQ